MMISPPDVGIREIVCHMVMGKEGKKRKERKKENNQSPVAATDSKNFS